MADFQEWLQDVSQHFQQITDEQKNETLSHLFSVSGSKQLLYIASILPNLLYRDFFWLLPVELSIDILKYLDVASLFNCSLVNKHWHSLVNLSEIWRFHCHQLCIVDLPRIADAAYYKKLFLKVSTLQVEPLKSGEAFIDAYLIGHQSRVMVAYYHNGKIVTGSDDHTVKVWDCKTEEYDLTFQTHTVSDVRLDGNVIYTSSFNGSIESWHVSQGFHKRYVGHVSAVLSIDICLELSILVSGSADLTTKVWDLSSTSVLATLAGQHKDWVIKVKVLYQNDSDSYLLVSTDKKTCYIWEMSLDHQVNNLQLVHHSDYQIVPHLLFEGTNVIRICFISDDASHGFIDTYNITPILTLVQKIDLPHSVLNIQLLLGVGHKFVLVLNSLYGDEYLSLFNLYDKTLLMRHSVPPIRKTFGGTSVTVGPTSWLNGFTSDAPKGVVFGAALKTDSIFLLHWNHIEKPAENVRKHLFM